MPRLLCVAAEQARDAGRCSDRRPGSAPVVNVVERVQDTAGAHGHLVADYQGCQEFGPAGLCLLGSGEHRRENYRARVTLDEAVSVVDVQGRGGKPVGERRADRRATGTGAYDGSRPGTVSMKGVSDRGLCRLNAAACHGSPTEVEQAADDLRAHFRREVFPAHRPHELGDAPGLWSGAHSALTRRPVTSCGGGNALRIKSPLKLIRVSGTLSYCIGLAFASRIFTKVA